MDPPRHALKSKHNKGPGRRVIMVMMGIESCDGLLEAQVSRRRPVEKARRKTDLVTKLKWTVVFPATGTLSLASPSQSRRRPSRITSNFEHVNLRHLSGRLPISA